MTMQPVETMQDEKQDEKDKLAHYLCHACNAEKIMLVVLTDKKPDLFAICGHKFDYGKNGASPDATRCVVCLEMYQAHEAEHDRRNEL